MMETDVVGVRAARGRRSDLYAWYGIHQTEIVEF